MRSTLFYLFEWKLFSLYQTLFDVFILKSTNYKIIEIIIFLKSKVLITY